MRYSLEELEILFLSFLATFLFRQKSCAFRSLSESTPKAEKMEHWGIFGIGRPRGRLSQISCD